MRKNFNSNSKNKIKTAIEANLGVILAVGLPLSFAAATVGADIAKTPDPRVPAWVDDFSASPNGKICTIRDLKTGSDYVSKNGKEVAMGRGFTVISSPSSCNVTAPNKTTCQLRGWPIEPIC